MKTNIFKITAIILRLVGWSVSCKEKENDETDDLFLEISPDSKSQVIEKDLNGIIFKFCLLNEQGEPATVFKEGDNFSFYFSVTNKRSEKVIYVPEIVRSNDNFFCKVFDTNNQNFGKPYISGAIDLIGIAAYMLDVNEICEFRQQWNDERDTWEWKYTHFKNSHRELLKRGDYYTEIKHAFEFVKTDGQTKFHTVFVNFKINFQIK
jgi:hypothetical protein